MLSATVKGANKLRRELQKGEKRVNKAFTASVKVEGFRLMRQFQKEIRAGNPGGRRFTAISIVGRKVKRSRKVLNKMALGIRYQVTDRPFSFRFGWVGPRVSKSWKRLAEIHQEGFEREVTEKQRRWFRRWGSSLSERSRMRRAFFLRQTTTKIKTPARPMRGPFWKAHQDEVFPNVRRNFRRKMAGERI